MSMEPPTSSKLRSPRPRLELDSSRETIIGRSRENRPILCFRRGRESFGAGREFVADFAFADFLQRDVGNVHLRVHLGQRPVALRELADAAGDDIDEKFGIGDLLSGCFEVFAVHARANQTFRETSVNYKGIVGAHDRAPLHP